MGRDRNKGKVEEGDDDDEENESDLGSESESGSKRSEHRANRRERKRKRRSSKGRKYSDEDDDSSSSSYSEEEYSGSESESEEERRRRKRKERKRREKREREKKRRRREKEKDKDKKKKKKKKKKEKEKEKEKKKREKGKAGAVTNSWGKYGIIRETDMWNKRPEFTAWLAEVKQLNLESLPNWEEKQMFKEFMEDHNTATFPSKKYYNLDAYYKHKMEKENKKGMKKVVQTEMIVFNDEEIRRKEMQQVRERQKAEEVEALKRSMQSGMAQAMKEQAQLREEMLYQYKLGNFEAAAAIQRRLDPDVAL